MTAVWKCKTLILGAICLAGIVGCSKSYSTPAGTCTGPIKERLDPGSLRHVLPGAPEPTYLSDPPTSGPHQPGPERHGVLTQTLTRPVQLGLLENGIVVVQYRNLTNAEQAKLNQYAGPNTVVAPNSTLPDKIVVTAWRTKLSCSGVVDAPIRAFVDAHAGVIPALLNP
jgi:hypothetical protein